jgi:putative heptosyl transferase
MPILKKLKEWNWRRNFAFKKIKLYLRYKPLILLDRLLAHQKGRQNHPVKRILLIRNDVIGDMIVSTGLIRSLAQAGYEVYVSSTAPALDIIRGNPHVSGVFPYNASSPANFAASLRKIRRHHFDLAVELRVSRELSLYDTLYHGLIRTDTLLGFNKSFLHTFNASIECDVSNIHVTQPFLLLLAYLHIDAADLPYELFIDEDTEQYVRPYIPKQKFAVINPFGSKGPRCLSKQQVASICRHLSQQGFACVLIGEPAKTAALKINLAAVFPSRSIGDVIALIKYADLVLTVDTSVVHIAAAFTKDTIGLYLHSFHPLAEDGRTDDSLKNRLSINFFRCRTKICYGLPNLPDRDLYRFFTVNNIFWSPNNPNAVQVFFPQEEISAVPDEELSQKLHDALYTIRCRTGRYTKHAPINTDPQP